MKLPLSVGTHRYFKDALCLVDADGHSIAVFTDITKEDAHHLAACANAVGEICEYCTNGIVAGSPFADEILGIIEKHKVKGE